MLVIEMADDKFGKAMKNIACIEEKLAEIKHVFEEEATSGDFRSYMPREERYYMMDREYRDSDRRYPRLYEKKFM